MRKIHTLWCAALFLGALGAPSSAQIKSLNLEQMVTAADNAVYGQITGSRVFRVDSLQDGPELYYTELVIAGRSLTDSRPTTVRVVFRGGFISDTEGVFNSEAPAADDVKVGRTVVAFYRWVDDLGGGVPANTLVAAHGGIYRTVEGPRGATVLGRGQGYAISANVRTTDLESAVQLYAKKKSQEKPH